MNIDKNDTKILAHLIRFRVRECLEPLHDRILNSEMKSLMKNITKNIIEALEFYDNEVIKGSLSSLADTGAKKLREVKKQNKKNKVL